jgi:hypothetical protein
VIMLAFLDHTAVVFRQVDPLAIPVRRMARPEFDKKRNIILCFVDVAMPANPRACNTAFDFRSRQCWSWFGLAGAVAQLPALMPHFTAALARANCCQTEDVTWLA